MKVTPIVSLGFPDENDTKPDIIPDIINGITDKIYLPNLKPTSLKIIKPLKIISFFHAEKFLKLSVFNNIGNFKYVCIANQEP